MPTTDHILDNPVWRAIDGPQAHLADRVGRAGRFHSEVSPFAAIADADDADAWSDLAELVGPGNVAILFAPVVAIADGWTSEHTIPCLQMVAGDVADFADTIELVELGPPDVPEMIELVNATRPGPFSPRTIEMGRYIGHRVDGRLVAMAGERLRCPGFTEISAVCTAEDQRGKGLARELTLAMVSHIRARGDEAFLHVVSENATAIRLYEYMGFSLRREAEVLIARCR